MSVAGEGWTEPLIDLTNLASSSNNSCVRTLYAAIAQPVERILGKDEVASSNLASSSKDTPKLWLRSFLFMENQLATSSHARRADEMRGRKASAKSKILWKPGSQFKSG